MLTETTLALGLSFCARYSATVKFANLKVSAHFVYIIMPLIGEKLECWMLKSHFAHVFYKMGGIIKNALDWEKCTRLGSHLVLDWGNGLDWGAILN